MEEKRNPPRFSEGGRGGLKIEFRGRAACGSPNTIACIWMRGSGTEDVFRVMADVSDAQSAGSAQRLERTLIEWQRRMVLKADSV
jgi:phosphoglucomutase